MRRVHVLGQVVKNLVVAGLQKVEYFSLAVDESTDRTDIAQPSLFVRYFDNGLFREELLGLIPLETYTTGEKTLSISYRWSTINARKE